MAVPSGLTGPPRTPGQRSLIWRVMVVAWPAWSVATMVAVSLRAWLRRSTVRALRESLTLSASLPAAGRFQACLASVVLPALMVALILVGRLIDCVHKTS